MFIDLSLIFNEFNKAQKYSNYLRVLIFFLVS